MGHLATLRLVTSRRATTSRFKDSKRDETSDAHPGGSVYTVRALTPL